MSLSIWSRYWFIAVRRYMRRAGLRRAQNMLDAADGNDDPVGAVVKFVADFVDGFVGEISFEHDLEVVGSLRDEYGAGSGAQITVQKNATDVAGTEDGPALRERHVFPADWP